MLRRTRALPTYNDGIAEIYREKGRKTGFGARLNPETMDDLEPVARLAYKAQSIREQDMQFAERHGMDFTMKVRTHPLKSVDTECCAIVGGCLYDISHIDRTATEMYLYLEGGEPFGQHAR